MRAALVVLLQVLAAAYALVAAQRVRGATAAQTRHHRQLADLQSSGSGSGVADAQAVGDGAPAWSNNETYDGHDKYKTTLFGGRHNDSIPSVGAYRRNVALLLQTREEESDQLQGCIAIAIAPLFFITRASCVRDQENMPLLFIEMAKDNAHGSERVPVTIKATTTHPNYGVNLAIVEVDPHGEDISEMIEVMPLAKYMPLYYKTDSTLSMVSIDNIFNPSLSTNPQSISTLIRVPVASCAFYSDDSNTNCYTPAELASRELAFEFGQGMLLHNGDTLLGLPDCEGICSGGMFYSTTHLFNFKSWIDEVTDNSARWRTGTKGVVATTPEEESTFVSLFTSADDDAEPVCAGSLIAPRFVLATASCVSNHSITIARMDHGKRTAYRSSHEDTIPVFNISIHPGFATATAISNDVAVIELSGPTFYTPMILASDDALSETIAADTCNPRQSAIDSSVMCLPPAQTGDDGFEIERRELQSGPETLEIDTSSFLDNVDVSGVVSIAPAVCARRKSIEQWNLDAGDAVVEVPETGSYYLLGLSTGRVDSAVAVGTNRTSERICSLNETVGDDDKAALIVRLATPQTMEFIDSTSQAHTWRNPQQLPMGLFEMKLSRAATSSTSRGSAVESLSYSGPLVFEEPPKDLDLGFVVGLRFDKFGQNYCGGSLIAPSYVLTAAHCVGGDRAKFVSVGSHESSGAEAELIAVKSSNIITHPLYGKRSLYSYDVAILELASQAYPKPIVLDNSRELTPTMYFTLFGYGADSAASTELSAVLRSVDLPYFARDKCKAMFPELDESMFCAGGELARDACTGDSGSPLVRIVGGAPRLVGVVSSGRNGCGTPGVPGVYSFVAEFESFINSVVAGSKWVNPVGPSSSTLTLGGGGGAGGGSGSSTADETRSADATAPNDAVLRSSALNMSDLPFEIINMANGSVEHQLSIVEMAKETPPRLQAALLEFLVGDYAYVDGWKPQTDEQWKVAFYSTGDLGGLMTIIAEHRAKPLYSRTNRFSRRVATAQRGSDEAETLSRASCR